MPRERITELHAWIATSEDGSEGLVAGGIEGMGMVPLVTSRRHIAEAMGRVAERALREARADGSLMVSVRLVTFRVAEAVH